MKKFERQLLQDLYESVQGLFAFTLYSRYKVEPSLMFQFIDEYSKKGVLLFENNKLELTKEGRDLVIKHLYKYKLENNKYSSIPVEILGTKIGINSPYLPNIKNVSKEILNLKKVE